MTIQDYFKKYSNLYQFEEGSPEYLIDSEDFKQAIREIIKIDRENVAKHAKVIHDGWDWAVDANSIFNTSQIEL